MLNKTKTTALLVIIIVMNISFWKILVRQSNTCLNKSATWKIDINVNGSIKHLHQGSFSLDLKEKERASLSLITTQKTPRYEHSHFMTLSKPTGRIGNRMFQVASLIGTAHKHGYTPVLRSDHILFKVFEMIDISEYNMELTNLKDESEYASNKYNNQFESLSHSKNWSLSGFLQSWKYFSGTEDKIRHAFQFKKKFIENVEHFWKSKKKEGTLNIGIHVRRGDFTSEKVSKLGYTVAPLSYFSASTEYFRQKYGNVQCIVASDSMAWCRENLINVSNVYFSNFTEPEMDMALLSSCDHVIITSGTFGWWAAWLSGGTVIYYKDFPKPDSWLDRRFNLMEYYPDHWIGM